MAIKYRQIKETLYFTKDKILIGCIFFLLLAVAYLFGKTNALFLGNTDVREQVPIKEVTTTPTATPVQDENTVNQDPITNCYSTYPNCKGQTIKAKLSLCKYVFCCVYPERSVLLSDKSQCVSDSTQNSSQSTNNSTSEALISCSLSYGTVKLTKSACDSMMLSDTKYSLCKSTAESKKSSCNSSCLSTYTNNKNICLSAYGTSSPNGYDDASLSGCFNETSAEYGSCQDACLNSYSSDLKNC